MKILIPVLDFQPTGGYRVLSELANSWIESGHQVSFLAPAASKPPYFPTAASMIWVDAKGAPAGVRNGAGARGIRQLISLYRGLNRFGNDYDVILANFSLTAFPVSLSRCKDASKFYYVQAYEPDYFWYKKNLKALLMGTLAKCSYWLPLKRIVNAPLYFKYKNIRSDVYVPPGLDLKIFKPADGSARKLGADGSIVLGCIGRLEPEKGIGFVLEAFERLYQKDQRYALRVAFGNLPAGWSHERCEVVASRNDHELARFYQSVDILIAPGTVQHGAPHYPVLEAMACGIPVVTTGYYGAGDATAWIVENKSSDSIVNAVIDLVNNAELTSSRSRQALQVARQLDWKIVSAKMMDCLESFRSKRTT